MGCIIENKVAPSLSIFLVELLQGTVPWLHEKRYIFAEPRYITIMACHGSRVCCMVCTMRIAHGSRVWHAMVCSMVCHGSKAWCAAAHKWICSPLTPELPWYISQPVPPLGSLTLLLFVLAAHTVLCMYLNDITVTHICEIVHTLCMYNFLAWYVCTAHQRLVCWYIIQLGTTNTTYSTHLYQTIQFVRFWF